MTYAVLELRVKRRIARRKASITADFLDEMQSAQRELEIGQTLPSILDTTTAAIETPAAKTFVTDLPPADYLKLYDDQGLFYFREDPVANPKAGEFHAKRLDTRNQLVSKRNASFGVTGGPQPSTIYYVIYKDAGTWKVEFTPEQSISIWFGMRYYAKQDILTGTNNNDWTLEWGDLISSMAGLALAMSYRDKNAIEYFSQMEQKYRRQMIGRTESELFDDVDLVMGDPD